MLVANVALEDAMNPQEPVMTRELYRKSILARCPRGPFGEMSCGHPCCPVVNNKVPDASPLWECSRIGEWRIYLWLGKTPEDIVKLFERSADECAGNGA